MFVLAAAFRFHRLGANSLWADEVLTATTSARPLSEVMEASIRDNNIPPLYFWLSHGIIEALGESETTLRLLSAASGALTVPVFFLLVMECVASLRAATAAAMLLALNPLHIWFSQEARPYSLLLLMTSSGLLFLVRAVRRQGFSDWAIAAAFLGFASLTHLAGLLLLPVAWIWLLGSERVAIRSMTLVTLLALACVAPSVLALVSGSAQAHAPSREASILEIPYTMFTYVGGYSFGPSLREIQNLGPAVAVRANQLQAVLGALVLAGLVVLVAARRPADTRLFVILSLTYLAIPLIGSRLTHHPFNVRYTLPALLGFLALVAGGLSTLSRPFRTMAAAAVVAVFVWSDLQWFSSPRYWKEDSRAAVTWISQHVTPAATVAVAPGYMTGPLRYYASRTTGASRISFIDQDLVGIVTGPDALAISREHHVKDPRSLEQSFRSSATSEVSEGEVVGYRLLAVSAR